VFVSFNTWEDGQEYDISYAFRLLDALHYMREQQRQYICMAELTTGVIPRASLKRLQLEDGPGYDLKGVEQSFKYT
jgi:hypothetical protein